MAAIAGGVELVACLAAVPAAGAAQQAGVAVHGIAYDSLRGGPLDGAIVSITGIGRTTVADRRGRFQIDSVPPGTYTFVMNHDAVDSLGLPAVSSRLMVTDGRAEIRLAIPSFGAFWSAGCARPAPRDSILVYGAVRRAGDLAPVAGAKVELAWIDLGVKGRRQVTQQVQTLSVTTDANGSYGFCGVPKGAGLRVRASTDRTASGVVDLPPNPDRVRWRALTVGPLVSLDSTQVGTIAGVVMRGSTPFANARVVMDEVPEVRTDDQGRFTLYNVPGGTRQVQVLGVGMDAVTRTVDVVVNSRTDIVVNMERVTTLAAARVTGTAFIRHMAEGLAERRKSSFGVFLDSTDFVGQGTTRTAFESVAGLKVTPYGRNYFLVLKEGALNDCAANVFIDGVRQMDQEQLWSLNPGDIKAVEIYKRSSTVPPEYQVLRSTCGSVAVWTRRTFP
ncbi:MAG TPA: carboxypeptidase regulatory-like domain-containing protein [Gemmatimonadaceae bacterium]|nr:carboxypeptidase regulatory-like domain-containing protein [Gemmatimonadaceae bacterium]